MMKFKKIEAPPDYSIVMSFESVYRYTLEYARTNRMLIFSGMLRQHPLHYANITRNSDPNNPNIYLPWHYSYDFYCRICKNGGFDLETKKPCMHCWSKFTHAKPVKSYKRLKTNVERHFETLPQNENIVVLPQNVLLIIRKPVWLKPGLGKKCCYCSGQGVINFNDGTAICKFCNGRGDGSHTKCKKSLLTSNAPPYKSSQTHHLSGKILDWFSPKLDSDVLICGQVDPNNKKSKSLVDEFDYWVEVPAGMVVNARYLRILTLNEYKNLHLGNGVLCHRCKGCGMEYMHYNEFNNKNKEKHPVQTCKSCNGWGRLQNNGQPFTNSRKRVNT